MTLEQLFKTESFVSTAAAWHQELSFDEPYKVRVVIENCGSDPIYGFYLNEEDFRFMIDNGTVDDDIMSRIKNQLLCENERATSEVGVEFPAGKFFLCLELDEESAPDSSRTEFRLSIYEVE